MSNNDKAENLDLRTSANIKATQNSSLKQQASQTQGSNNQTTQSPTPTVPTPPPPSDSKLVDYLEEHLKGPIFVVWGIINGHLLWEALNFITDNKPKDNLNIIVQSIGGNPDRTFAASVAFRDHCKAIKVYVPTFAKSAATLLCLCADEIIMNPGAELGPLDMQVPDPRNSTETISALSGYRALEAVANFLHNELEVTVRQLLSRAGTNLVESLKHAMQLITPMTRPLFEQVNPLDLGAFSNALDVSQKYGQELLVRSGRQDQEAQEIADKLVRGYPSHSFVIDIHEAKNIGLNVRQPTNSETEWIGRAYKLLNSKLRDKKYSGLLRKVVQDNDYTA